MKRFNPIKSYPPSKNRLLIIDWASLSYHQMFGLVSKYNTNNTLCDSSLDLSTPEGEMRAWSNHMFKQMIKFIKLFNPKDIVCALEGNHSWRIDYVYDYYMNNTMVYYDSESYYLRFDNFLYKVTQQGDSYSIVKLDHIKDTSYLNNPSRILAKMPDRIKTLMWDLYLPNGITPLLPYYKGTRKSEWDFLTSKSDWKRFKEEFAIKLSNIYRGKCIRVDGAEGDDTVYVTTEYMKNTYDSIILVTNDSDFNQLLTNNKLKIYNHVSGEMVECLNPSTYLELKILHGDNSDNIQGIALPSKKTQLGEVGAMKLFESFDNIFDKATAEGWDNQYIRNKTLIDMKFIPTHIQRNICEQLDNTNTSFEGRIYMESIGLNEKLIDVIMNLKNYGYYSLLDRDYVNDHPDIFSEPTPEIESKSDIAYMKAIEPKSNIDNFSGVFFDPSDVL